MKTEIAECCRRLRLSRNIAAVCDQVEADSYQEYLLKILKQVELVKRLLLHADELGFAAYWRENCLPQGCIFDYLLYKQLQ